jgi:alpha-N-arabinofuranosidase
MIQVKRFMKNGVRRGLICCGALVVFACTGQEDGAVFRHFSYEGQDVTFALPAEGEGAFRNPILSGFYPDPSIVRKGKDYFLATSSFAYYPGIPIFHSTDLVNWKQVGHALNRPSQLAVDGVRLSGGVYAPTIRYNEQNGMFYIINTCVGGVGNFIIKTKNPLENDWSEPVPLRFGGIDPDLFFDEDGRGYIVHNDEPPGEPEWGGHRAIWLREFSVAGDSVVGEKVLIVDGGVDKRTHPVWIEAPHLYKIGGFYYLMCAEGGTSTQHSEVIFRAERVTGPYVPWADNPILTQRDLRADRANPVTCAGHADLVQTAAGDWYAVFLGCRPYEGGHYNTGRETFMLPVEWVDGYPVILRKGEAVPYVSAVRGAAAGETAGALRGNFAYRDEFRGDRLDDRWVFIRTPRTEFWSLLRKGGLWLRANGGSIYRQENPAFVGARQQHICFEARVEMEYIPKKEKDLAGLVCFQNEGHNFVLGKTMNEEGVVCVVLDEARGGTVTRLAEGAVPKGSLRKPVLLKIAGNGGGYGFYVSYDRGGTWVSVFEGADGSLLSTETAGGFTGVVLGMYVGEG